MPELFLELFSEEIPARMQARAAEDLARLLGEALAPIAPKDVLTFHGPRRIALRADVQASVPAASTVERGPRTSAPEQALAGFLRKHGASREQLVEDGGHWVLTRASPAQDAGALVAQAMPPLLRRFPWPKSMRWGRGSGFVWVRPLRRIICTLDGALVPFDLRDGDDDGHGLQSGTDTEGHRQHAPGAFPAPTFTAWHEGLRARRVIPAAGERRRLVAEGIAALATAEGLQVVPDDGLLDEVAGLVEWPVPLLGRIDNAHMDLPPEVMQVSMRVNQRYFALRHEDGTAAPRFGFAANIEATDGGAAIIAGNERVLRARFSDARHFWDLDRRTKLADRVAALDGVTFHAKLGSQRDRVRRLVRLARQIAPYVSADPDLAARAALLCKADLTSGMVGEFPELQGVMGGYYAQHDGEDARVATAIREHYAPKSPNDQTELTAEAATVALADKLDQITLFFAVREQPTGSGDPYGLRRSALGIIKIITRLKARVRLRNLISEHIRFFAETCTVRDYDVIERFCIEFDELKSVRRKDASAIRKLPVSFLLDERSTSNDNVLVDQLNQALTISRHPKSMLGDAETTLRSTDVHTLAESSATIIKNLYSEVRPRVEEQELYVSQTLEFGLRFQEICDGSVLPFIADRLRVQLRAEGARHDVLSAVFAAGADDDIVRLLARTDAVAAFLATPDGADLLAASKRAANILRIEDKRDGPHDGPTDAALFTLPEEHALDDALDAAEPAVAAHIAAERFTDAMLALAALRAPLDAFFDKVTVNAPEPELRLNRLRLLRRVGAAMNRAADFSRIEG